MLSLFLILFFPVIVPAGPLFPDSALNEALQNNLELAAEKSKPEAESAAIVAQYFLNNPRFGFMRESNMTSEQRLMGDMSSWMMSQEILFPAKYFAKGALQKARAKAAQIKYFDKQLEIRQRVLSAYYNFYSASRNAALLEAQKQTLREIARIAEARRATGSVPQQDEMRAHVEQTRIENEILLQNQQVLEAQIILNTLLNREPQSAIILPREDLRRPQLKNPLHNLESLAVQNSRQVQAEQAKLNEAYELQTLARLSYFPDFTLSYRRPTNLDNAYTLSVEMTLPLWFFARQNSEIQMANAKALAAEKQLELIKLKVGAETQSLTQKVETLSKLLKIYDTALIPQSASALNSSQAAYRAGKVGFQELLDAERSLYATRIEYFKNLARYVESLTALERIVGQSLSDLPSIGETK